MRDPAAVRDVLLARDDIVPGDGVLRLDDAGSTVAWIELRTVRLTLYALGRRRLDQARAWIERVLGTQVRRCGERRGPATALWPDRAAAPDPAADIEAFSQAIGARIERARRGEDGAERSRAPWPERRTADGHRLPPTARERMYHAIPSLQRAVERTAEALRERWPEAADRTLHPEQLIEHTALASVLRAHLTSLVRGGWSPEDAAADCSILGGHLVYLVNHELHRRKTFWVDEDLAWMLSMTDLDIQGACLQLPFPTCAFVFTDAVALELGESLLAPEACKVSGKRLHAITAYVMYIDQLADSPARPLQVCLLFDAGLGGWPYMVTRYLEVMPDDRLEAILDSRPAQERNFDPLFLAPELHRLVHLTVNAILYSTSADVDPILLDPAPQPRARRSGNKQRKEDQRARRAALRTSAESVLFLPGKIEIGRLRRLSEAQPARADGQVTRRFLVRGHWRRAARGWQDQRVRWIEPYWKGPDLGEVIEREYRLRP